MVTPLRARDGGPDGRRGRDAAPGGGGRRHAQAGAASPSGERALGGVEGGRRAAVWNLTRTRARARLDGRRGWRIEGKGSWREEKEGVKERGTGGKKGGGGGCVCWGVGGGEGGGGGDLARSGQAQLGDSGLAAGGGVSSHRSRKMGRASMAVALPTSSVTSSRCLPASEKHHPRQPRPLSRSLSLWLLSPRLSVRNGCSGGDGAAAAVYRRDKASPCTHDRTHMGTCDGHLRLAEYTPHAL